MIPQKLIDSLAKKLPWRCAASHEGRMDLVTILLSELEKAGARLRWEAPIEMNGPAGIVMAARHAREAHNEGNTKVVHECLDEAENLAQAIIAWLEHNANLGARLPVSWTDFVHQREEK